MTNSLNDIEENLSNDRQTPTMFFNWKEIKVINRERTESNVESKKIYRFDATIIVGVSHFLKFLLQTTEKSIDSFRALLNFLQHFDK